MAWDMKHFECVLLFFSESVKDFITDFMITLH